MTRRSLYGPGEDVTHRQLVPGVAVKRWTEIVATLDKGLTVVLDVAVPCCDRSARVRRRVARVSDTVVACQFCQLVYELQLVDENDGGFGAELLVTGLTFVVTRRRPRRKT